MTSQTTAITAEEILAALQLDRKYQDPAALAQLKEHIVVLPEVIGPERLASVVTIELVTQVVADFLSRVLADGCQFRRAHLTQNLGGVPLLPALLKMTGHNEQTFMLAEGMNLIPPLQQLFKDGRLTFADIVRQQPGFFVE